MTRVPPCPRILYRSIAVASVVVVLMSWWGANCDAATSVRDGPATVQGDAAAESFRLTARSRDFARYFPTILANGYFSTESSRRGTKGALTQMVGLMDYSDGDVSRPVALPSWTEIDYFDGISWLNNATVSAKTIAHYRQILDMREGTLMTRYLWRDGTRITHVAVKTLVSEDSKYRGVSEVQVKANFDGPIRLRFTLRPWPRPIHRLALAKLDLGEAKREISKIYGITAPGDHTLLSQILKPATPTSANRASIWYPGEGVDYRSGGSANARVIWIKGKAVHGRHFFEAAAISIAKSLGTERTVIEQSNGAITLEVDGRVSRGKTYKFGKFVELSDGSSGDAATRGVAGAVAFRAHGFSQAVRRQAAAWHSLWRSDIVVTNSLALQRAIHADLFYLLENATVATTWPMGACGFSPNYFQHVFWDNDSCDFPVLLLLHPRRAKSLIAFRERTLPEAEARARANGYDGAMYPWEADLERGDDQTPYFAHANGSREIHVNGDVAIAQWQYYLATGDREWLRKRGYPVIRATAKFWKSRVVYRPATKRYEILHVTSPDEAYNDVANDAFTNSIARRNLQIATLAAHALGVKADPAWRAIANHIVIPFSSREQRHLDFDASVEHDKKTWMGSAVALLAYPQLDLAMAPEVRRHDFDYAVRALGALTPDPNAMLLAMITIEAAEIGNINDSQYWLNRQQGQFLKPPFDVRSETAANNTTHILATSAGFLQDFLYGFSGLRLTERGFEQKFAPILPPEVGSLTLKNIAFRGERFDYVISRKANGRFSIARRQHVSESGDAR